jgi:hypothetical protein
MFAVASHPTDESSLAFIMECTVSKHKIPHGSGGCCNIRVADEDSRCLKWRDGRFANFKERYIALFATRLQEYNAKTSPSSAASTTTAMKEGFWVSWGVELHDNIYLRNVETSRGNIGGKKDCGLDSCDKAGEVLLADLRWMLSVQREENEGLVVGRGQEAREEMLKVVYSCACGKIYNCFLWCRSEP